jgi:hypothetical protein
MTRLTDNSTVNIPETKLSKQFSPEASKQFIQFENHMSSNKFSHKFCISNITLCAKSYGHKILVKCWEVWWNIKLYLYMQKVSEYSTNIQRLYQLNAKKCKSHKLSNLGIKEYIWTEVLLWFVLAYTINDWPSIFHLSATFQDRVENKITNGYTVQKLHSTDCIFKTPSIIRFIFHKMLFIL